MQHVVFLVLVGWGVEERNLPPFLLSNQIPTNMRLQEYFQNVFSYAAGMEDWVNRQLPLGPLQYTFAADFAIADWYDEKSVKETYERVKKEWLGDYKAFTEVVIALNMLSWAHNALNEQGIDGREPFINLYASLYHQAFNDFYDRYTGNREACDYFFEMTD